MKFNEITTDLQDDDDPSDTTYLTGTPDLLSNQDIIHLIGEASCISDDAKEGEISAYWHHPFTIGEKYYCLEVFKRDEIFLFKTDSKKAQRFLESYFDATVTYETVEDTIPQERIDSLLNEVNKLRAAFAN